MPVKSVLLRPAAFFPHLSGFFSRSVAQMQAGDVAEYLRRALAPIVMQGRPALIRRPMSPVSSHQ
jgi:hypothetical protein